MSSPTLTTRSRGRPGSVRRTASGRPPRATVDPGSARGAFPRGGVDLTHGNAPGIGSGADASRCGAIRNSSSGLSATAPFAWVPSTATPRAVTPQLCVTVQALGAAAPANLTVAWRGGIEGSHHNRASCTVARPRRSTYPASTQRKANLGRCDLHAPVKCGPNDREATESGPGRLSELWRVRRRQAGNPRGPTRAGSSGEGPWRRLLHDGPRLTAWVLGTTVAFHLVYLLPLDARAGRGHPRRGQHRRGHHRRRAARGGRRSGCSWRSGRAESAGRCTSGPSTAWSPWSSSSSGWRRSRGASGSSSGAPPRCSRRSTRRVRRTCTTSVPLQGHSEWFRFAFVAAALRRRLLQPRRRAQGDRDAAFADRAAARDLRLRVDRHARRLLPRASPGS